MRDPLWVAEYTLYLEENFCSTQSQAQRFLSFENVSQPKSHIRCIDLVKEHFPPMHSMAMDEFWNPDSLCGVQSVCQQTTSNPGTTTGYMTLCFFIKGKGHI